MAWIQIEDELIRLERVWGEEIEGFPGPLRDVQARLLVRMNLGRGHAASWPRLFAPWTSLYPLLQAEAFDGIDLHQATRLNLAHLAFLVHAFIDDRRRDRQIVLDETEEAFSRRCFDLGMERLNDELPNVFPSDPGVRELLEEYEAAQSGCWTALPSVEDSAVRLLARGRAIHGYLAPLALMVAAGASPDQARSQRRAYEELVTGLQWGDDAEDWEGDWRAGRQNLLLSRLSELAPETAAISRESEGLDAMRALMSDLRIQQDALDCASRNFAIAADIHDVMGCFTLAGMIRMLKSKVEKMRAGFPGSAGGS